MPSLPSRLPGKLRTRQNYTVARQSAVGFWAPSSNQCTIPACYGPGGADWNGQSGRPEVRVICARLRCERSIAPGWDAWTWTAYSWRYDLLQLPVDADQISRPVNLGALGRLQ